MLKTCEEHGRQSDNFTYCPHCGEYLKIVLKDNEKFMKKIERLQQDPDEKFRLEKLMNNYNVKVEKVTDWKILQCCKKELIFILKIRIGWIKSELMMLKKISYEEVQAQIKFHEEHATDFFIRFTRLNERFRNSFVDKTYYPSSGTVRAYFDWFDNIHKQIETYEKLISNFGLLDVGDEVWIDHDELRAVSVINGLGIILSNHESIIDYKWIEEQRKTSLYR